MKNKYIIGIDTGGTYTDAVLFDTHSRTITGSAKSLTTHFELSLGIKDSLSNLLQNSNISPDEVSSVAVSSTLATNSVVEKKGGRIAVIVIGYVKHFKLPVKAVVFVKGGHTIKGEEEEPLDIDYLVQLINGLKTEVDGYAVCSAMSIKNPTHELVAEKAIGMLDPKPVFCSHRISQQAGMQERAATAGLHAKLMPIMIDFMDGVHNALTTQGLHCPLVVVGGNGAALQSERVQTEAGLTVASGPACSAAFGAAQKEADCLVIDVGGTTTDIAMIKAGSPVLSEDGCQIGDWKTHVEAINMYTAGVGGDSHIFVDDKKQMSVGPKRVIPLSMTNEIPDVNSWFGPDGKSKLICLYSEVVPDLPENEVTSLLKEYRQLTPDFIRKKTGLGGIALEIQLEHLLRKQQIFECGFTPTDALHVLGEINIGDTRKAIAAADLLGAHLQLSGAEFARLTLENTEELVENLIIDYIAQYYWKTSLTNFIATRKNHPVLGVEFSVKLPLIGIGAAARYLLPNVAKKLQTEIIFPDYCEVGNAVGAAIICDQHLAEKQRDRSPLTTF